MGLRHLNATETDGTMPTLNLSQATLFYETHEPATACEHPPLMLVAGLASDSQSWLPVMIKTLSQDRLVITLDNRGCGRTTHDGDVTIEQMASDCIALADHLGITQLDMLGHSMGGMIALTVARLYPDRLHRLVLCNSSMRQSARNRRLFDDWADAYTADGPNATWYRSVFYWLLTAEFFEQPTMLDDLVQMVLAYPHPPSAEGYRQQGQAIARFDASAWLGDIHTSTLVLAGEVDLLFPPGEDASGLAAIPHAQVKVLPGQSHSMPMLAPGQLLEAIAPFLGKETSA